MTTSGTGRHHVVAFLKYLTASLACALILAFAQTSQSQSVQSGEQLFVEHIRPLLDNKCLGCHSGDKPQSGLDLSSREGLLRGGTRGPAIVAGDPTASLLYKLVSRADDPPMPPGPDALPKEVTAKIGDWIRAGAPYGVATSKATDGGFDEHVRPVFEAKCLGCHAGANKRAGLDLSTRETLMRGGDDGVAVVPGKADESVLMKRLRHETQPGMPFQSPKLPDNVIAKIADWINAGAPYSRPLKAAAEAAPAKIHWAFQRPVRPALPSVQNTAWVRNPIDSFIAAEHEKKGLKPLPEAEKRVLLRRVYVDLIGLPPTPTEMQAFLADKSPDAYEKVVDRLLADPRYGQRWGRHWMDVWRYSDPDGYAGRVDYSHKHVWQWRDWIVESLNKDKGYDRMVTEMLAGDELSPTDPDTLRATGYLVRSWYRFNRHSWLQDTVDQTATAFLGVTLRCARCHEHKYDPIQQEEYYRFRAFFEPYDVRIDPVAGEVDPNKNGLPRTFDAEPREAKPDDDNPGVLLPGIFGETRRLIRGDEASPDDHALTPGVPQAFGGFAGEIKPVDLPVEASYPSLQPFAQEDLLKVAKSEITKAEAGLDRAKRALANAKKRASEAPVAASAAGTNAAPAVDAKNAVNFDKEIKPLFEKSCFACHNSLTSRSGLSLETVESILAGGNKNGPAVIARNAEDSPLLQYLRGDKNPRMPMNGDYFKDEQLQLIAKWIDQLPQEEPAAALRNAESGLLVAEKELAWARANLPALEARIAADKAKYEPAPGVNAEALAETARKAERQAHLLKAESKLLQAQRKLTDALSGPLPADEKADKDREKKITAARQELEAAQKSLTQSTQSYTNIGRIYPTHSSGRRTALARWIVSPENPLAARVAVNHMWMRHFGKPLVPTVDNFGMSGMAPTHPQLLDWLATELMQQKWSMKALHRVMVTSSTYRMASATPDPKHPNLAADTDNRYFWRMNPRRMEAEAVRDSVLYLAGQLDAKAGGPPIEDINSHRRGMYFKQTPYSQTEFLKLFDAANPSECYQRTESIVPQQALALANSTISLSMARKLARDISADKANAAPPAFVAAAFETILGRPPSDAESAKTVDFLTRQTELLRAANKLTAFGVSSPGEIAPAAEPDIRARENLVHVLFNHNEFVTVR